MDTLIGNRIKKRREELGMTQQELADRVGYAAKSSISLIESGRVQPPFDKVISIAQVLSCEPSELLGTTNEMLDRAARWESLFREYLEPDDDDGVVIVEPSCHISEAAAEILMLMEDLPEREQWKLVGRIEAYVENYLKRGEHNEKI